MIKVQKFRKKARNCSIVDATTKGC